MSLNILFLLCLLISFSEVTAQQPSNQELIDKAHQGDGWAQLNLGAAYDNGMLGLEPDAGKAVTWYRRAANNGIAEAEFNLAHCLATGHGVDRNDIEARKWMHRAAKNKIPEAQYLLGVMYQYGIGGGIDTAKAHYWLMRAAKNGHQEAQQLVR